MSSYVEKRQGKRRPSYRCQVIIKQGGRIVYRDQRTFSAYRDAVSWGAQRDKKLKRALDDPEQFETLTRLAEPSLMTVGEAINWYRTEYAASFGRTVGHDLDLLSRSALAKQRIATIKAADVIDHIKRRVETVSPATASTDLTRLQVVFDAVWSSLDLDVPRDELEKARLECRRRRLVAKPKQRERVATDDELQRLCTYFDAGERAEIPMSDIVMFAVYSCRRQDEITQLRWADNDPERLTGVVPRLKDPSGQRTDVTFRYTQEAWDIVQRQPETDDRIFPYNSKSIGSAFTRACKVLGIPDLRFHDLRHTAVTRLFKIGYPVHEVTHFSLHRSWATLKRYTNTKPHEVELR